MGNVRELWRNDGSRNTVTVERPDTPGFPDPMEVRVTTSRPATSEIGQAPAQPPQSSPAEAVQAEIVVKGRNVEVPDHFRVHVAQKLARVQRLEPRLQQFDIELFHERNRRQRKSCQRVEITARGRGPVVRSESSADSFYAALDQAMDKLESRLRRTKDRRRVHYGEKTPRSVAQATAELVDNTIAEHPKIEDRYATDTDGPGHIVRTKVHPATPMTVDDALYQMELVGHDFFLFQDKESDRPSVVYRRRAFDYGLIRLA